MVAGQPVLPDGSQSIYPPLVSSNLTIHNKADPSGKPCDPNLQEIVFDKLTERDRNLAGVAGLVSFSNHEDFSKCVKELSRVLLDEEDELNDFVFGAVPYQCVSMIVLLATNNGQH